MTSEILSGPLAQALGLALLHLLWQGAIVAGLLAATLSLLSRSSSHVRYVVSCIALAALLAFGVATTINSYEPTPNGAPASAGAVEKPVTVAAAFEIPILDEPAPGPTWQDSARAILVKIRQQIPQIVMLWLAGVLLLTIRLTVSWNRARALTTHQTSEAPAEWQVVVKRLSKALNLKRAVKLLESAAVEVPSVIGWARPVVLIPMSGLTGLTTQQLEMILAHELAHIRRHDFMINVLQSVAETLLFYHPAAWWISHRIRIERENCCDDLAVSVCGNPIQYARALTQLEQLRAVNATAVAANGGSLLDRVRRLAGVDERRGLVNGWTASAAALTFVALLLVTTSPANAQKKDEPKKTPKPAETRIDAEEPEEMEAPDAVVTVYSPTPRPTPAAAPAPRPLITPTIAPTPMIAPVAIAAMSDAVADGVMDAVMELDQDEQGEQSSPTPEGKLSIDELISLRVSGITPEYIESMRKIFGNDVTIREMSNMRLQGVTPEYVREMRTFFGSPLTSRDIVNLRVQGVTTGYVTEMRAAGVDIKTAKDAVSLKVQGVSPSFVKSLRDAGYDKISVRDLTRLAAVGVNAEFIREMSKYRTEKGKEKQR